MSVTSTNSPGPKVPPGDIPGMVPSIAPPPKKRQPIQRHGTVAGAPGKTVAFANRWRENYNPLRQLSIAIAVSLLERGQRGDMALLQWTYRFIERRYPTLSALMSRCEAPLLGLDWDIRVKAKLPTGATAEQAAAQQQTLRDAYDRIDNLKEAIRFLHLADFRGYAHLQKHYDAAGRTVHFETLHQWTIARDGIYGDWFWNPDSRSMTLPQLVVGESNRIGGQDLPADDFVIRVVDRPIDEIGLVNFVRANLCEKDWDAFIEIYGLPGGVVVMPPNVPPGKEAEYQMAATQVAQGGSGAIPNGSSYEANDGPRAVDPFTPRVAHLDAQLIMAGTGGKLTMLAESGSGTLAGGAHTDTFQEIAQMRAAQISEVLQRQFDGPILAVAHPGEPVLVYFALGANDETATDALVKDVVGLAAAGFKVDRDWLAERTGYQFADEDDAPPVAPGADPDPEPDPDAPGEPPAEPAPVAGGGPAPVPPGKYVPDPNGPPKVLKNRQVDAQGAPVAPDPDAAVAGLAKAVGHDLQPVLARLQSICEIEDPIIFERKLRAFYAEFPDLQTDLLKDPAADRALVPVIVQAFAAGLMKKDPTK